MSNATWVSEQHKHLKTKVYAKAHQNIEYWNKLVDKDFKCYVPKGEPTHKPPDAQNQMNKAVGQIDMADHSRAFKPDKRQIDIKHYEDYDAMLDYIYDENDSYNQSSVQRELVWDIAMGFGALKGPFWDKNALSEGRCPVVYAPINNTYVFPSVAGDYVIIAYDRYIGDIEEEVRRWNEKSRMKNGKAKANAAYDESWISNSRFSNKYDKVSWLEYWSATKRCFVIGNGDTSYDISGMQTNQLGYIPVKYSYSGWGRGRSCGDPAKRAIGWLKGMEEDIEANARNLSALGIVLRYFAFPRWIGDKEYEQYFEQFAEHPAEIMTVPREAMPSQGGLEALPQPQMHQNFFDYVALVRKNLEEAGGSPALSGQGPTSESGLKAMTRIRQSAIIFDPPRRGIENIYSELETDIFKLLQSKLVYEDEINFGGTSIRPTQIPEYLKVRFKMEVKDPMADAELIDVGLRLLERQGITLEELRKVYMKDPNYGEYIEKLLAEKYMLTSPEFATSVVNKVLTNKGIPPMGQTPTREMVQGPGGQQPVRTERNEQRLESGQGAGPVDTRGMAGLGGLAGG